MTRHRTCAEPKTGGESATASALAHGASRTHPRPDHPVMQELGWRRALLNEGADLSGLDTKLGLVVEGGGMRGVISGGALIALERLGLTSAFDEVYGESAGAINACYFLAGEAADRKSVV